MRIAPLVGLATVLFLTASCGGTAKESADSPAPTATVTVTTTVTATPSDPAKASCTLSDGDMASATFEWEIVVASVGASDAAERASGFYDRVSELADDHDEEDCGGADQLAMLVYQAALLQASASVDDTSQGDLEDTARVGNRWLSRMNYTSSKFHA
jgi:hypothetical protein